jgi:hypothetical protein
MTCNATVTRIFDTARLRLPGATDGVMQLEFMNMVQDFCITTSAWVDATDVKLEPQVNLYDLVPPDANGDIKRIMYVENLDREAPQWTAPAWMPVPGVMQIGFIPQAEQDIVVYVALQPNELGCKQSIPAVPDWLFTDYTQTLTDGLISNMLVQPAKPYSNPQMGQFYLKRYISGKSTARIQAENGRRMSGQRWTFPQGFAVRRRKY